MPVSEWKAWSVNAGAIAGIAVFLSASAAPLHSQVTKPATEDVVLSLDQSQCKVYFTVDSTLHTVHGTFNLKNGFLRVDPATGKAAGEIVVSASSGDSGNGSRDAKMHNEVLESKQYPEVNFKPTQVEGKFALAGPSDVKLHGVFSLHGGTHELVVPVHAEISGDRWKGTSKFQVPYVQWGMKDPSSFLLKVKSNVEIELELAGPWKLSAP
jgi:polyisoprenoid-binding protein YceI